MGRKRNTKRLTEILDRMTGIRFSTTWEQAQQMLLDNPAFADDDELLAMDKEDALIVFEDHIRELEKEEERKRIKRSQRKNRDAMIQVLDELHEAGKLTSMSLWVELYPTISADIRFTQMLGQPGSTPLDLFKFYVEDLKSRFYSEKKIIKEILKEKSYEMSTNVTFEDFATVVCEDKRSASLDAGNVKLTYNALLEKAESREKERQKEESRKLKKLETSFRLLLSDMFGEKLDGSLQWEDVRPKLEGESAFEAIPHEYEKIRMFKDFQKDLEETCMHNHGGSKSSKSGSEKRKEKKHKKEKRRRKLSTPSSPSDTAMKSEESEGEIHSPKKDRRKSSSSSRVGKKERKEKEKDTKYYSDFSDSEFSGGGEPSDFSDDGKKTSRKSKNKKNKKNKDRERSRSMEPISPPPVKKRKSEKSEKTSPGSLSPVSEEEHYTTTQLKVKKPKKGNKKQRASKDESTPSKDFDRVSSPSPPPSNPSSRRQSEKSPPGGASSAEEGELSEDELEQKRIRLLRELQEDS